MNFKQKTALDIVSSKHLLSSIERNLLYRCVHSDAINEDIRRKTTNRVSGEILVVDFYNLTTTVSEALEGYSVYRSTDLFVRDIATSFGRSKKDYRILLNAFENILECLAGEGLEELILILDKQVSHSKLLGEKALDVAGRYGFKRRLILSPKTDLEVSKQAGYTGGIAVSSDILVLLKSPRVHDLAGKVITRVKPEAIVEFWSLVLRE